MENNPRRALIKAGVGRKLSVDKPVQFGPREPKIQETLHAAGATATCTPL